MDARCLYCRKLARRVFSVQICVASELSALAGPSWMRGLFVVKSVEEHQERLDLLAPYAFQLPCHCSVSQLCTFFGWVAFARWYYLMGWCCSSVGSCQGGDFEGGGVGGIGRDQSSLS